MSKKQSNNSPSIPPPTNSNRNNANRLHPRLANRNGFTVSTANNTNLEPVGRDRSVTDIFSRDEYQQSTGTLHHIHELVQVNSSSSSIQLGQSSESSESVDSTVSALNLGEAAARLNLSLFITYTCNVRSDQSS